MAWKDVKTPGNIPSSQPELGLVYFSTYEMWPLLRLWTHLIKDRLKIQTSKHLSNKPVKNLLQQLAVFQ